MDNKPIDDTWVQMAMAAILHFDGDMATLVRWMGGTHVGAHRDTQKILNTINGIVDDGTFGHVRRLYTQGAPAFCNAESSEANFQAYLKYGNHSSVYDDVEKTRKTLTKVLNRGYCMLLDKRMVYFTLNCHVTPQGLIDLHHKTKDPRPIFDSSFRPHPWCYAINDWTSKTNEPPITFPEAWTTYLQWLYNLRISYPDREIYPGDDDVSGAYRHMKYHPNSGCNAHIHAIELHGSGYRCYLWRLHKSIKLGSHCASPPTNGTTFMETPQHHPQSGPLHA
jgi:hypothetical protein